MRSRFNRLARLFCYEVRFNVYFYCDDADNPRFVDRDMMMRYIHGLGVGHTYFRREDGSQGGDTECHLGQAQLQEEPEEVVESDNSGSKDESDSESDEDEDDTDDEMVWAMEDMYN
jgi:hypothetical protein